jgi:G3E family GTPase
VNKLKERLLHFNPAAIVLTSIDGNSDVSQLFSAGLYDPSTKKADVQRWLKADVYEFHTHNDKYLGTHHDDYIESFCIEWHEPLRWKVLNYWFKQLTALRGKDLLRVKGIAYTVETDLPVVIQGVQHIFQPPTTLPAWPSAMSPCTQIVFITRNINKKIIEEMLRVLIKSETTIEACAAALILLNSNASLESH